MIRIRRNVFETNSSSTHSVAILKKEDWEAVKRGELFIDVFAMEKDPKYPRLVTEEFLLNEGRKEYLEEERGGHRDYHTSIRDGHYISWEEIMANCKGDYRGYDLNIFGFTGEKYINPKSNVWWECTEQDLGDGNVHLEIEHFFG